MDKRIFAAYRSDKHNAVGGRVFLGYVGWHPWTSNTSALAAARVKFPDVPAECIAVVMI